MIHRIAPINSAAASRTFSYNGGTLSHLLFGLDVAPDAASFVTVTKNSPFHQPITLVNRIPLTLLAEISNIEAGAAATLQIALNAATGITDYVGFFFCIDLGCLHLRETQSTLEILIENGVTWGAGSSMAAVNLRPDDTEYSNKLNFSSLLVSDADSCDRVFICYATGSSVPYTDANLNDLSVEISSDHGDRFCTIQDCIAFTAVFGQIEGQSPQYCYAAYIDNDDVHGKVSWQVSGTDADSDISVISRTSHRDEISTLKSARAILNRHETKVTQKTPDAQAALVASGKAIPPKLTEVARKAVNEKTVAVIAKRGGTLASTA